MSALPATVLEAITFRRGTPGDEQWLFTLFRTTMQHYIDAAWGWEELLQREGFVTSLPTRGFQILEYRGKPIGSYHLSRKFRGKSGATEDYLLLDMIIVEPGFQRQGFGQLMMEHVQDTARQAGLAVQLNVLKANPAVGFHQRCGFSVKSSDQHSLVMAWSPVQPDR